MTRTAYHKCVAKELKGKTFRSREAQRRAMKRAARKCSKKPRRK